MGERRPEYGPSWFVSPWNFRDDALVTNPPRLVVHDTTLRDGEQQAGVVFTADQKVRIAHELDAIGIDRIEAGMVAVSEDDRVAIKRIVASRPRAQIWTIARSLAKDIEMAIDCGVNGVGVILLANKQYNRIFGWTLPEAMEKAIVTAETGRRAGLDTSLLIADSPRLTDDDLRYIVVQATSSGHFTSLALMDTFGALSPDGTRRLVETVRSMTQLPLEIHAHNDFGLATANSVAALVAGANTVHTAVNGLGERVGNAAMEEVVLASALLYGAKTHVDFSGLRRVAELVSRESGIRMAPHKPVVGETITHIESGTVASEYARWSAMPDAELQWLFAYLPEMVGAPPIELVLGKYSGMANVDATLERLGRVISDDAKSALLQAVKSEGVRLHRCLTLDEFEALIEKQPAFPR